MRDEFPKPVRDVLAKRVGYRCSNPNCRNPTSGPQDISRKSVNVGVAAHIAAASPGGPRFDAALTSEARKSVDNGIWLCGKCERLVDRDETHYTSELLRRWKQLSEEAARLAVESGCDEAALKTDIELLRFYAQCFDRPAFQDQFHQEGSMEAFDRAMEDTITAFNTGCLRSRDGPVLQRARGKKFISNPEWRTTLDTIVDMLRAIRSRYDFAVRHGQIHLGPEADGSSFYCINDQQVAEWMDATRFEIVSLFSGLCDEAGIQGLHFPPIGPRRTFAHPLGQFIRTIYVPPPKGMPPKKSP